MSQVMIHAPVAGLRAFVKYSQLGLCLRQINNNLRFWREIRQDPRAKVFEVSLGSGAPEQTTCSIASGQSGDEVRILDARLDALQSLREFHVDVCLEIFNPSLSITHSQEFDMILLHTKNLRC
jgi:hypothetical protein